MTKIQLVCYFLQNLIGSYLNTKNRNGVSIVFGSWIKKKIAQIPILILECGKFLALAYYVLNILPLILHKFRFCGFLEKKMFLLCYIIQNKSLNMNYY